MTIAVDFDGTLAEYRGFKGVGRYGLPVQIMLRRVQRWLKEGKEVVIFTSRVWNAESDPSEFYAIREWLAGYHLLNNDGTPLEITAIKHPRFKEIWDDRAVAVKTNSGEAKRWPLPVK